MPARSEPPTAAPVPAAARFADIRGQERAIGFLRQAWEGGRLAHAYLFTGPTGVGKLAAARALARGVHCERAPFDACGECSACRTIAAGTHPDVRSILGPLKERRDISIDQIRELQRALGFRSLSPHPKVGIINDADLLTLQAQNALLKTLEEPGGDSLLILVGGNASALAPTILSRCQRLAFDTLPVDDVVAILRQHGRSEAEAIALAAYADGSPGRALLLDPNFFTRRRPELLRRLATLRGGGFQRLADFAAELVRDEEDLAAALTVIASFYRDGLRRAALGPDVVLQNADLAADLPAGDVAGSLRNLEATYGTISALRQNANRNLALVQMLLQLSA